jgi:hypothetical protein
VPEDLRRDGQIERDDLRQSDGDDPVRGAIAGLIDHGGHASSI